ncbi:MAG: aldehyde dehydrogenase [Caldilineaceae bacterium]|nr:aldehyde dehydrogenase [Caldilineaceae bacterium]
MNNRSTYAMYINGEWVASASGAYFAAISPATGEEIGLLPEGTRQDAQAAIAAANGAAAAWAARTPFDRATILERVATVMLARRDDLALTLTVEQGKPLHTEAYGEVDDVIDYFRMAAGDARRVEGILPPSVDPKKRVLIQRVPRGVIGVITPWNWPYEMPAELIAPALAYGNTVVWTPAPSTAICAVKLVECLVEAALPPGVLNLVIGPGAVVGDEIAHNAGTHTVAFIGSIATGQQVAQRAAGKDLLLELGGNGPLVILDDADLDAAVAATLTSCLLCAGQSCSAGELILVQATVADAYLARLCQAVDQQVRLGLPLDPTTTLGPLNNAATAAKMDQHIDDALAQGAQLLRGGQRAANFPTGLYYPPTVLSQVTPTMLVAREETFGPIMPVMLIQDEAEALALINASSYGLLTAIFTRDLRRALHFAEAVRAGWVNINESTNWWELHLPFGGRAGSQSGVGRVGGRFAQERFTELKTIVMQLD